MVLKYVLNEKCEELRCACGYFARVKGRDPSKVLILYVS